MMTSLNSNASFVKRFSAVLFVICALGVTALSARTDKAKLGPHSDFQVKKKEAKESFIGSYFNLLKQGHFSSMQEGVSPYSNNLIISADVDSYFPQNGPIILALIEWLQRDENSVSKFLLRKLNKYFYLELHSFISQQMEIPQEERAELLGAVHSLYRYEVDNRDCKGPKESRFSYPFQSVLSKISIAIYMVVYNSEMYYYERRESVVYYFEKLRTEIIDINESLANPIEKYMVHRLMLLFEAYTIQEPVVKRTNLKRAFIITGIVLSVAAVLGYFAYKGGFKWLNKRLFEMSDSIGDGLANAIVRKLKVESEDITKALIKGASGKEAEAAVENAVKVAVQELDKGAIGQGVLEVVDVMKTKVVPAVDGAVAAITEKVVPALDGAVEAITGEVVPALDGAVEAITGKVIPAVEGLPGKIAASAEGTGANVVHGAVHGLASGGATLVKKVLWDKPVEGASWVASKWKGPKKKPDAPVAD